jgi:hypothetical protein
MLADEQRNRSATEESPTQSRTGRSPILLLVFGFLTVIAGVPLGQIGLELRHGQRVQFAELFRTVPSAANLRRYEKTLEENSWVRRQVRPIMQGVLFASLRDMGSQALLGSERWLFYRPGVRYLLEGDRPEPIEDHSVRLEPTRDESRRDSVLRAIVRYRDQLQTRGIGLVVMPVPEKSSVYPDMLTRRAETQLDRFRSPTEDLLAALGSHGVETIDLFTLFREARRADSAGSIEPLYLAQDTHWTPTGAKLAADTVAARLRALGFVSKTPRKYASREVAVERFGDVLQMIQIPGMEDYFSGQTVQCRQITDTVIGPMVPRPGSREGGFMNAHFKDTPWEPSILLLGDSFSRIYQTPEPQSLGRAMQSPSQSAGSKCLLPGSAGFASLLAEAMKSPVDYILADGGAATDVRRKLSVYGDILENKKVVLWEFTERDVGLGRNGWQDVELPPEL